MRSTQSDPVLSRPTADDINPRLTVASKMIFTYLQQPVPYRDKASEVVPTIYPKLKTAGGEILAQKVPSSYAIIDIRPCSDNFLSSPTPPRAALLRMSILLAVRSRADALEFSPLH